MVFNETYVLHLSYEEYGFVHFLKKLIWIRYRVNFRIKLSKDTDKHTPDTTPKGLL